MAGWACAHLGQHGCTVYHERPLVSRLFGATPALVCPHGRGPARMIDIEMEKRMLSFLKQTRHVLI